MKAWSGRPVEERFWEHVRKTSTCWLWISKDGKILNRYGRLRIGSRADGTRTEVAAHWYSWELHSGQPVPAGSWVLHTCDVKACIRPEHLYLGSIHDNNRDRKERFGDPKLFATHCKRGHKYLDENVTKAGEHFCSTCRSMSKVERQAFDLNRKETNHNGRNDAQH